MSIPGNKKATLTPKEKHIIGEYILKHCSIPEGSTYARWDEESGGSDITVAEKLKPQVPKITVYHIRYLRQAFDLQLEPPKIRFIPPHKEYEMTDLDHLRDKLEAMAAHMKECDARFKAFDVRIKTLEVAFGAHATAIKDIEARLSVMEDKYTNPKVLPISNDDLGMQSGKSPPNDAWLHRASEKVVATVVDPMLPPIPSTMYRYRKGKHRR